MEPEIPEPRLDRRLSDLQEERRRRRERWLIGIVSIAIGLFTYMEVRLSRFSGGLPVTNNLLFFGMVNINVILTLLLVFLVFRNVAKLVFDRRSSVTGARLRTKLILAFAGFTLIPAVLLFSVATGFVVNSVNSWFDPFVETSLTDALEVARLYYQRAEEDAMLYADRIALSATEDGHYEQTERLHEEVERRMLDYRLDEVEVYDFSGARIADAAGKRAPPEDFPGTEADLVAAGIAGTIAARTQSFKDSDVVRGVAPIWPKGCPEYSKSKGQSIRGCRPVGAVVASIYVPQSLTARTDRIYDGFAGYRQLKIYKSPLKTSYVTMLTTITLLVIFAASWLGIHLSKEIVVPLKSLAEATRAVAQGNLDVTVPDPGSDEIGQVVSAFNKMTADLKSSREGIRAATADLTRSNVELEQRRRYMEVVLTNIAAGVVAVDREGRFSAMNDAAARLLSIDPATVIGRRYREVLPEAHLEIARDFIKEIERQGVSQDSASEPGGQGSGRGFGGVPPSSPTGEPIPGEARTGELTPSVSREVSVSIKGEVKTVKLTVTALRDASLGYIGMVVVLDDLTPILRGQRVAAWREVARRIAHEIKNPLTPVRLSAQRLRRRFAGQIVEGREVFDECTTTIETQVEELRRMVNEFSEFARMPEARPIPGDLNATVGEAVTLYANAHEGTRVELTADPAVPRFNLDREQIKRAVINLLDNACAAVQEGGGTEVQVATDYDRALGIVRVTIADDGPGMSDEVKSRLFEPYFSTKKAGTGLGLTIVHRIVADHEGFIRVQENRPRGTRFVIELPAKAPAPKPRGTGDESLAALEDDRASGLKGRA